MAHRGHNPKIVHPEAFDKLGKSSKKGEASLTDSNGVSLGP